MTATTNFFRQPLINSFHKNLRLKVNSKACHIFFPCEWKKCMPFGTSSLFTPASWDRDVIRPDLTLRDCMDCASPFLKRLVQISSVRESSTFPQCCRKQHDRSWGLCTAIPLRTHCESTQAWSRCLLHLPWLTVSVCVCGWGLLLPSKIENEHKCFHNNVV